MYNKGRLPLNWENFKSCISMNNIRGYDAYNDFRLKYPFATVHFLLGLLSRRHTITLPVTAISPLLFTDGTWMNLFRYTENSLSWIEYLQANDPTTPLHTVFCNDHYSVHELMLAMNDFLRERDKISVKGERGDRIALTKRGGTGDPENITLRESAYALDGETLDRAERFIGILARLTGWDYIPGKWSWFGWKLYKFTKVDFEGKRLNNGTFLQFIQGSPLSYAITGTQRLEYTVEEPDRLP